MMNDGNPKPEPPESKDSENLDGMAKAFIVSVAWSYAEALERTKRARNPQEPAPESQAESPTESPTETVVKRSYPDFFSKFPKLKRFVFDLTKCISANRF